MLDQLGNDVKELTLIPSRGGVFEVTVDRALVFSKKKEGRHPTIDEITKVLRRKLTV
ncbi:MAG: Rdx family protein [Chloroflexi bacterium]|nr:Rdx family protein [Chloroflexota bacterium]